LEDIVVRDPAFAPAWGLLAQAHVQEPLGDVLAPAAISPTVTEAALNRAERAAREAIRLDAKNANGYGALADIPQRRGNWAEAEDIYRQAFALDPNEPNVLGRYGAWLNNVGRNREAISISRKVRALDPLLPRNAYDEAMDLQALGQYEASIPLLEGMRPDDMPDDVRNRSLAQAYAGLREYAKAADLLLASKGDVYSRQSIEDAARLLRAAPAQASAPLPELQGQLRFVYAYVGAADRILAPVEQQVARRYIFSLSSLWDPEYAPTRKSERFKRLMRNAGLVDFWRARGWPDLCRPMGANDFVCD
jgi:tetratricopeptide (TPR) repeat protein